jgi:CheY-specific phosphatase CheX
MRIEEKYMRFLLKAVKYIFRKFLNDEKIEEVFEFNFKGKLNQIIIEFSGTLKGEIIIHLPQDTLKKITKKFISTSNERTLRQYYKDVSGEVVNQITGTFANQMQYEGHNIILTPPEFNDDPISIKALYENINMCFYSSYGPFEVDLFFREN